MSDMQLLWKGQSNPKGVATHMFRTTDLEEY